VVRREPDGAATILSNIVLSQIEYHAPYGGVVPEIAARAHIVHLDRLIGQALREARLGFGELDGVAATAGPGGRRAGGRPVRERGQWHTRRASRFERRM